MPLPKIHDLKKLKPRQEPQKGELKMRRAIYRVFNFKKPSHENGFVYLFEEFPMWKKKTGQLKIDLIAYYKKEERIA